MAKKFSDFTNEAAASTTQVVGYKTGTTVDIEQGGSTILSTLLTIDASEKTSYTAATPVVISDTTITKNTEIKVNIDQIGSGTAGKGLKVMFIGYKTPA